MKLGKIYKLSIGASEIISEKGLIMVWINYSHLNVPAPPGFMGGSICMCEDCCRKREPKPEKTAIEIMQEVQVEDKYRKD